MVPIKLIESSFSVAVKFMLSNIHKIVSSMISCFKITSSKVKYYVMKNTLNISMLFK